MSKATLVIEGFLARDGELRTVQNGSTVLRLTVPHTPRRKGENGWEDAGDTLWVDASLWGEEAEAFAEYAVKGAYVRLEGEPQLRQFTRTDGESDARLQFRFAQAAVVPRRRRESWADEQTPF